MPNPYDYEWDGESYNFTTDKKVIYRVVFSTHGDLFKEYPTIHGRVFSFDFYAVYPESLKDRHDSRVKDTLAKLITEFFQHEENFIVFVCDSMDGRADCRKRLFEKWFGQFNNEVFLEKYDGCVAEGTEYQIHNSIILRTDLHDKDYVLSVFEELNDEFSSKPVS